MNLAVLLLTAAAAAPASDTTLFRSRSITASRRASMRDRQVLNGRCGCATATTRAARLDTLWFHLHLNAFRPNSAWARRELEYGSAASRTSAPMSTRSSACAA
jgi:hypothetical protein